MLLVAVLALAATVSATPLEVRNGVAKMPLTFVSSIKSAKNMNEKGRARLNNVNGLKSAAVTNEIAEYVASVSIGGKDWVVVVDTGSSITWIGAQHPYVLTPTGKSKGESVGATYGSGYWYGGAYTEKVSFAGLTVKSQTIGVAKHAVGFDEVDGIIGFGPVRSTRKFETEEEYTPTFTNNLYKEGTIKTEVIGIYFKPSRSDQGEKNGEVTIGGIDTAKFTGPLTYYPAVTHGSDRWWWSVDIAAFAYGSKTLATSTRGIVDTGTTLIYIPTKTYDKFLAVAGGRNDTENGWAVFDKKPTSNFVVTLGTTAYTLTPDQYLLSATELEAFGLGANKFYAAISYGGHSGLTTTLGLKFLEYYYSVFDTTNNRIGFAKAA